jgi:Raf kinase inhibitor-like YbhB/YbcL family protein
MAQHVPSGSGEPITIERITPYGEGAQVQLTCAAFPQNGSIPLRYAGYGDNVSPPLQWTAVPGAKAWALILEDPDAPRAEPFLHWMIWNIPGDVTSLPEALPRVARLDRPEGAIQGRNHGGDIGYRGPRPPPDDRPHRYHFQLFALGEPLQFGPDARLQEVVNALKGDVVAQGELIGLYQHRTQ